MYEKKAHKKRVYKKKEKVTKATKAYVKKAIDHQIEQKYIDTLGVFNTVVGGVNSVLINGLVNGSQENNRIGDKIKIKELRFMGELTQISAPIASNTQASNMSRVLIIWDKQPNGGAFTFGGNGGIFNPATANYDAVLNFNTDTVSNRYHILYDKTFQPTVLAYGATPINGFNSKGITIHRKIKVNKVTNYGLGNTGTITDINTGSLYLINACNSTTGVSLRFQIKMLYEDA